MDNIVSGEKDMQHLPRSHGFQAAFVCCKGRFQVIHALKVTDYVTRQCFPRSCHVIGEPFRIGKKKQMVDSPTDVIFGRDLPGMVLSEETT